MSRPSPASAAPKVYVIHENEEWLAPLRDGFAAFGTPYEEWLLDTRKIDLREAPPEGVFFSRMSASNYTRGHVHATRSTDIVLRWLEAHGRRVVNGHSVLALEVNKPAQQILLDAAGIATPETVVAVGREHIMGAAESLGRTPFIVKPGQGGKGAGVQLFESLAQLEAALEDRTVSDSVDGVWLVQEKIGTEDDYITRAEFVDGRFLYAVRVYSGGSFELCPADVCNVDFETFCPAGSNDQPVADTGAQAGPRFEIDKGFDSPLVARLEEFLASNGIEVAGVEFIRRPDGTEVVYDINTNTNYNAGAEADAGLDTGGMKAIAAFLDRELAELNRLAKTG